MPCTARSVQPSQPRWSQRTRPDEVAEFDTRVPHWFGSTGDQPTEILSLFGPQGERLHVRANPRQQTT